MLPMVDVNMDEARWAGALMLEYQTQVQFMPQYQGDWVWWGTQLLLVPEFAELMLPRPEQYTSWQEWARIVKLVLET